MSIAEIVMLVLKISIVLNVFVIGLGATTREAIYLQRRPGELARVFLSMNVLMPLLALVMGLTFSLKPEVRLALLALSVCPVPPILPMRALKAGGNHDYTIGLLVTMALLAVIAIPLSMEIFEGITGTSLSMSVGLVLFLVVTTILAPLLTGIAVRALLPSFAERALKPLSIATTILLAVSAVAVLFGARRTIIAVVGDGTLIAMAAFASLGLIIGHFLGGPDPEKRSVLALATASRHPALAIAIVQTNFPELKLASAAIFLYLILSAILVTFYLWWAKRASLAAQTARTQVS